VPLRVSAALRLLWGLLLLLALALAASPPLALVLLATIVVFLHPFRRKEYGRPSVTLRGEVVRSNSERVIADWFSRRGIRGRWGSRRIGRPDFYLPDYGLYVEYWGLVDAPDDSTQSRYESSMGWKVAQYRRNGIRFVSLHPSELGNLDAAFRSKLEYAVAGMLLPSWLICGCSETPR
jgi:hypothetical protein